MSRIHAAKTILLCLALSAPFHLAWADNHYGPKAIEARVQLGDSDGAKVFEPNELTFERGNYYKLIIANASPEDHYFQSDGFATHIFTRKIRVRDGEGEVIAEIHGAASSLELAPGAVAEWWFFPMTKGANLKLYCSRDGHEESGMAGSINITGSLK